MPAGDVNTDYLGFLEHYRDALRSPRRYLLIGTLVVVVVVVLGNSRLSPFLLPDIIKDIPPHLTLVDTFFSSTYQFFSTLLMLGSLYYCGVQAWALSVSGWHIRKLSRAFEFRIEPVHPDIVR